MQQPSPWAAEEGGKEPGRSWAGPWLGVFLHASPQHQDTFQSLYCPVEGLVSIPSQIAETCFKNRAEAVEGSQ